MPLTLLHGPAGSGKTDYIIKQIAGKHLCSENPDSFILIVPQGSAIDRYQKMLLREKGSSGLFIGETVASFEQFLLRLLKINLPRVHLATGSLTRNALRRLLFENNYPSFREGRNYSGIISELETTLIRLKKSGLTPEKTKFLFDRYLTRELIDLCQLFADYQELLEKISYFDAGDLYKTTLNLINEKKLKLPENLKTLYVDRIFPLTLGHREIIKNLSLNFPTLEIFVSYSFDYQAVDEPHFYPAYSFLGETAQSNKHFQHTNAGKQEITHFFSDPAKELEWIVQTIQAEHQKGTKLDEMGVILPPNPFYHHRLSEILSERKIPSYPSYTPKLSRFSCLKNEENNNVIPLFLNRREKNLQNCLSAISTRHDFEHRFSFEQHLILSKIKDTEMIQKWREDEEERIFIKSPLNTEGIALLSLSEASAVNFSHLFIAGYTDSYYPSCQSDHPFYTTEMLTDANLREILEGPTYIQGMERYQLDHAKNRTGLMVYHTYPKILWDGREQFISQLDEKLKSEVGLQTSDFRLQTSDFRTQTPDIKSESSKFPTWKQKVFSVSELTTYQQCPFRYYASHYLKLGKKRSDETDAPPDVRGSFIHRVLDQLFKNNLDLYHEAIEYDLYLNKLKDTAADLVEKLKKDDEQLNKIPSPLRDSFCRRVSKVIGELLKTEIELFRKGKKKTTPMYFEWSFGKIKTPPLKITADNKTFFISGRIDRIDVDKKRKIFSIIDYKTGDIDTSVDLKTGVSLQIPLYLSAAASSLFPNDYKPASCLLMGLKDLSKWSGLVFEENGEEELLGENHRLSLPDWQILQKNVFQKTGEIIMNIKQGNFTPNPSEISSCRTCDYRDICHFEEMEE